MEEEQVKGKLDQEIEKYIYIDRYRYRCVPIPDPAATSPKFENHTKSQETEEVRFFEPFYCD